MKIVQINYRIHMHFTLAIQAKGQISSPSSIPSNDISSILNVDSSQLPHTETILLQTVNYGSSAHPETKIRCERIQNHYMI